jgi:hypothetical protein
MSRESSKLQSKKKAALPATSVGKILRQQNLQKTAKTTKLKKLFLA